MYFKTANGPVRVNANMSKEKFLGSSVAVNADEPFYMNMYFWTIVISSIVLVAAVYMYYFNKK